MDTRSPSANSAQADRIVEAAVVAGLVYSDGGRSEALELLTADLFSDLRARTVFEVVSDLFASNEAIDPVKVMAELRKRNLVDQAGGPEYIADAIERTPNVLHPALYAVDLRKIVLKRRMAATLADIAKEISQHPAQEVDPEAIYERIAKLVEGDGLERRYVTLEEALRDLEVDCHKKTLAEAGIPSTGLLDLDRKIAVLKPSNFTVLAARPGVGKSTLMRQMAMKAAESGPVLIFSLEESIEAVRDKMLCSAAGVSYWRWYSGGTNEAEDLRMIERMGDVAKLPVAFFNRYTVDAATVRFAARTVKKQRGALTAIFIDHLQLMKHPKGENRDQAVGETTRLLRLLSLELDVPIVLLCQMNRGIENRGMEDKRPRLADLRESGNIEANAPNVIFLWRENPQSETEVILTVAKHRDGQRAEFPLFFNGPVGRFEMCHREGIHDGR